jgi:uncharacterized protein YndB with AHSA1/START domain
MTFAPTARPIQPVDRSIVVAWDVEEAFRRFALDFGTWWPSKSHSVGGPRVRRVVFEPRVDGLIFEEHVDGRRFQWGQVTAWDPPGRLAFTFHPARDPSQAQDVEVTFAAEAGGTRVRLVSVGWEKLGVEAVKAQRAYSAGWGYLLEHWAGRWSAKRFLFEGVIAVFRLVARLRGGAARQIAESKGEIAPA